ncbi:MAG: amino acid permease [Xanthomonadaceae bacterium]|nr:amino acid permease [Xanthomonadaceae bacterium]MDP2185916.1 amino acid permease [Xanthomonadales bacterium]MDZ4116794.1 amino acid permease [Xanthomonadaceae bacterium]MDZ4379310.1 amino acid permease [Xanthomonadaceae bacterium]
MLRNLFITKPIAPAGHVDAGEPVEGSLEGEITLKRTLTAKQLFLLGVGAIIGAGIFVMTGTAAANYAGPAVILSFVIAGTACAFAGLCYAEFAAMLPVSGSAYSYAYTTLGELVAWFIGWTLVLEYLLAASTVAVGWSGYMNSFLGTLGMAIPDVLSSAPLDMVQGSIQMTGSLINLPAVLIVAAITGLVYVGISQSAWVNAIIVTIKVVVILLFLAFGLQYVNPENWVPFIPDRVIDADGTSHYGIQGVIRASAVVFFAYIGFDAVSTAAGEAKNPQRDMPIGILGSLVFCTILYIAMAAALTGMMPYSELGTAKPVATALQNYPDLLWLKTVVELGAIAGLSSVILVMLMGQPRIFYSMAKDGLMPSMFGKVHPTHRTPYIGTVIVGVVAAAMAGLFPISFLGDLVSMGTLLAFATVCIGVLILRSTRPDIRRPFRVPAAIIICPLGAAACLYLFWQPFMEHWHLMVGWTAIGMSIYVFYGYRHSRLRKRS